MESLAYIHGITERASWCSCQRLPSQQSSNWTRQILSCRASWSSPSDHHGRLSQWQYPADGSGFGYDYRSACLLQRMRRRCPRPSVKSDRHLRLVRHGMRQQPNCLHRSKKDSYEKILISGAFALSTWSSLSCWRAFPAHQRASDRATRSAQG